MGTCLDRLHYTEIHMTTEIPRPPASLLPDDPIVINIPPPEVGIERVTISSIGVLVVRLKPVDTTAPNSSVATGDLTRLVSLSNGNYSLTTKGSAYCEVKAWFADGSMYSAKAQDSALTDLVSDLNAGQPHDLSFNLQEVVGPTQPNILASLESIRLDGELSIDYSGTSNTSGVGLVAWGYHIDVARLQQLRMGDALVAASKEANCHMETEVDTTA